MAISNYTELQSAVADWLNRTDLESQIKNFIALAEAKIRRKLRRTTLTTTVTASSASVAIPADVAELRALNFINTSEPWRDKPLDVVSPTVLSEKLAAHAGVAGRPLYASVYGGEIHFAPVPNDEYTLQLTYFTNLPALSASAPTNAVLTEAPDLYLYGALLEAEPFLEHDERAPLWERRFEAAVAELNNVRTKEEYNASLRPVRLPVVFG